MKIAVFVLVPLLSILFSCKPSPQKAAEYNDKIVAEIIKVRTAEDSLGMAVVRFEAQDLQQKHYLFLKQVNSSIVLLSHLEKFNKKENLKLAALSLMEAYKSAGENELRSVAEIAKKEPRTEEDINNAKELLEQVSPKLTDAINNFSKVQHAFAEENRFVLEQKK